MRYKQTPTDAASLGEFVGREIVGAVASLGGEALVGPWPATLERRRLRRPFQLGFLPEDHHHPHAELCHLLSGSCALSYRLRHYRLTRGELVFFPPGVEHAETFCDRAAAYRLAWWIFLDDSLVVHVTNYTRGGGFRMMERVVLRPLGQENREACRRLARFCQAPAPPPLVAVKEAMLTLAVALLRRVMTRSDAQRQRERRELVEQVCRLVDDHANQPLSIAQVARHVLLSPNYLTTLFRAHRGVSLGRYIKRRRIAQAKSLLAEDHRSIKQIAFALGFEDPYTFSRAFRQTEGISPLQYRRLSSGRS